MLCSCAANLYLKCIFIDVLTERVCCIELNWLAFCGSVRDLTRFAALWLDVSDRCVHFGVPADWEARWGEMHFRPESEPKTDAWNRLNASNNNKNQEQEQKQEQQPTTPTTTTTTTTTTNNNNNNNNNKEATILAPRAHAHSLLNSRDLYTRPLVDPDPPLSQHNYQRVVCKGLF